MQTDEINMLDRLPQDWQRHLHLTDNNFEHLAQFLELEYNSCVVYPPQGEIFKAFAMTSFDNVKVVILGQDPYHKEGQANGLAFAVRDDFFPKPPSLRKIFNEVERDCQCTLNRSNSSLLGWAQQGILLLNTTLTVRSANPLSHTKQGWEEFTDRVIQRLVQRSDPVVFLLWGKHAQTKASLIKTPHFILSAAHPSPLARGFAGCGHFSKVNQILTSLGKLPIDWIKVSI